MSNVLDIRNYREYVFNFERCDNCGHEQKSLNCIEHQFDNECSKCHKMTAQAYYTFLYKGTLKWLLEVLEEAGWKCKGGLYNGESN